MKLGRKSVAFDKASNRSHELNVDDEFSDTTSNFTPSTRLYKLLVNPCVDYTSDTSVSKFKLIRSIQDLFESWQDWQKRLLLTSIIGRFSKVKLQLLNSAIESIFHKDFKANIQKDKKGQPSVIKIRLSDSHGNAQVFPPAPALHDGHSAGGIEPGSSFDTAEWVIDQLKLTNQHTGCILSEIFDITYKEPEPVQGALPEKDLKPDHYCFHSKTASRRAVQNQNQIEEQSAEELEAEKVKRTMQKIARRPLEQNADLSEVESREEFPSRMSQLDEIDSYDFFSLDSNSDLGLPATSLSKSDGHYVKRLHRRSEPPIPTTKQVFKRSKLWPDNKLLVGANKPRLLHLYRQQLEYISKNLDLFEEHERVRIMMLLLSHQKKNMVQFMGKCIKQKLTEAAKRDLSLVLFPEEFWFRVFRHLSLPDFLNLEQVSKKMYCMVNDEVMWRNQVQLLGREYGVRDLVGFLESYASDRTTIDWRLAYFDTKDHLHRNANALKLAAKQGDGLTEEQLDEFLFSRPPDAQRVAKQPLSRAFKQLRPDDDVKSTPEKADRRPAAAQLRGVAEEQIDPWSNVVLDDFAKNYVPFWKLSRNAVGSSMKFQQKGGQDGARAGTGRSSGDTKSPLRSTYSSVAPEKGEGDNESASPTVKRVRSRPPTSSSKRSGLSSVESGGAASPVKQVRYQLPSPSSDDVTSAAGGAGDEEKEESKEPEVRRGGFLEMWKNITEEIEDRQTEADSGISDRCYEVPMRVKLADDDELMASSEPFFVDHHVKQPATGTGKLWLLDNAVEPVKKVYALEAHRVAVYCIVCHNNRIFTGGLDRRIRMWTSVGNSFAKIADFFKGSVQGLAIGCDDKCKTLYASSWDTTVTSWDTTKRQLQDSFIGHTGSVCRVAVDDLFVVSASHDGTVRVWDIKTRECLRVIHFHSGAIYCMSYEKRLIITGGIDRTIILSNPKTGRKVKDLIGHQHPVTAITRQHHIIASGDLRGWLMIWTVDGDGAPLESVLGHKGETINAIKFNGGRFFTASSDKKIKEWELLTMKCVRILQGHTGAVTDIDFSERYLASSSRDGTCRLWFFGNDDLASSSRPSSSRPPSSGIRKPREERYKIALQVSRDLVNKYGGKAKLNV